MNQRDLGYLAGFFDGEGSVSYGLTKGRYLRLEISVSQNTVQVPEIFVRLLKTGKVYQSKAKNGSVIFQWKVYGEKALDPLQVLIPYLIVKKVDAQQALELWARRHDLDFIKEQLADRQKRKDVRQWHLTHDS
jgi:hypothetical protein